MLHMFNLSKFLSQRSAVNGNNNIVDQRIVNNAGLTYNDVKQISNDVFEQNIIKFSQEASVIARLRAEEFSEQLIARLHHSNPEGASAFSDPGLQSALFKAMRHYAGSGDQRAENVLIDLLVERTMLSTRNLDQIVVDESISVIGKISYKQMNLLALMYVTTTCLRGFETLGQLSDFLTVFLKEPSLFESTDREEALDEVSHINYAGCTGSMGLGGDFPGYLDSHYGFGFGLSRDYEGLGLRDLLQHGFISDSEMHKLASGAVNSTFICADDFREEAIKYLPSSAVENHMLHMTSQDRSKSNIRNAFSLEPFKTLHELFEYYEFGSYFLTPVGKAIAKSVIRLNFSTN